jgi:phage terminase small subunit
LARPLTQKQTAFAAAYLDTGCATKAYKLAYSVASMSDAAIWVEASRLLAKPIVQAEIEKHRAKVAEKTGITIETLCAEQDEAMELARETKNASAYAAASMNKAKLLGLVTDKVESRQTVQVLPADLPPDTLDGIWQRIEHEPAIPAPAKTSAPDPEPEPVLN